MPSGNGPMVVTSMIHGKNVYHCRNRRQLELFRERRTIHLSLTSDYPRVVESCGRLLPGGFILSRSYDIADLMTSDGEYITDNVRRKINGNFRRVLQLLDSEVPAQQSKQIAVSVTAIVNNLFEQKLPEMKDQLLDELCPVGSVIVTASASDPRLSHGTWQQVGGGRYVRAAGDGVEVMATGGSNLISADELPDHAHAVASFAAGTQTPPGLLHSGTDAASGTSTATGGISGRGEGFEQTPHVPEYIALLFYRRIA